MIIPSKILKYLVAVFLFVAFSCSQKENNTWIKMIGSKYFDECYSIAVDDSDNVYFTGVFSDTIKESNLISKGGLDVIVGKLDSKGNLQWIKKMGSKQDDEAYSVVTNGNLVSVCGYFSDTVIACNRKYVSKGNGDAFVWILSSDGKEKSFYTLGSTGQDEATSLEVTLDNKLAVCGFFEDTIIDFPQIISHGNTDAFVALLNEDKGFENIKQFGGIGNDKLICSSISKSGNLLFGGNYFMDSLDREDNYILKLDKNLKKIVSFTMGGEGFEQINSIAQCNENIIISGEYKQKSEFSSAFIASISPEGKSNWIKTLSSPKHEWAKGLYVTDSFIYFSSEVNDSAIISLDGNKLYHSAGSYDVYLGALNQNGNLAKQMIIQGKGEDGINKLIYKNGSLYFCGWVYDEISLFGKAARSNGEGDLYIVKTNEFK